MNELGRYSKELVDAARSGDDPLLEDRRRIRRRLAQLGVGAVITVAGSSSAGAVAAGQASAKGAVAGTLVAGGGTSIAPGVAPSVGVLVMKMMAAVAIVGGIGAAGVKGVSVYRAHHASNVDPHMIAVTPASLKRTFDAPVTLAPPAAGPSRAEEPAPEPAVFPSAPVLRPTASPSPAGTSEGHPLALGAPSVFDARGVRPMNPSPDFVNGGPVGAPARVESTIESETRLLRDAEALRRAGDGARALALLDEHAARFPNGDLAEERAAGRVFALCDLGRVTDARAEARQFLSLRPRSPLASRVRGSCAGISSP